MYSPYKRVKKITDELNSYVYQDKLEIKNYEVAEGNYVNIEAVEKVSDKFRPYKSDEFWGGYDKHCWFKTEVEVPQEFDDKTVSLLFYTDEDGWDAVNPQFILYVNGDLIQGVDVNHREVLLDHKVKAHEKLKIDIHAYSGLHDKKERLYGELVSVNKEVRKLYFNIETPLLTCEKLDEDDKRRIDMLSVLNETINLVDLRKPYSKEFFKSVDLANKYIEEEFYEKMCGQDNEIATCVGHTHIDVAWLWTVSQTREKAVRSFSTVLKLMQEYPEYIFMSSQPQLYEFVKERNPELYKKIKEKVKEGVWEPEGGMWLEADCNVTSGESLVRQIIHGKRFFKKEFNKESEVLWLPDVFGYSAALPQILKKSNIKYFMTTKISWNEINKVPYDTFMWQGIDGTDIFTYFITTTDPNFKPHENFTTYNGQLQPGSLIGGWKRYQQKEINNNILIAYGFGDGGGGVTREMLEMGRRMNKGIPGCPKVEMGTSKDYFEKLEKKLKGCRKLPKWVGELYLEFHRGTYTSMGKNKKFNRKCELLYQDIENLSSFDKMLGGNYPYKEINSSWKNILLNQFHDILPGSCIKEVYETTTKEYKNLLSKGRKMLSSKVDDLCSKINLVNDSIVVFNTLSFDRDDIVTMDFTKDFEGKCVKGSDGNIVPMQVVNEDGKEKLLLFVKNVPSKGYKAFRVEEGSCEVKKTVDFKLSKNKIENKFFSIDIDKKGTFTSIYDKLNKREVLKKDQRGNVIQAFEDKPTDFDNWNIDIYFEEKMWEVDDVKSIKVIENGPVRGGIRIERKFLDSSIVQDIYVYNDISRIDFNSYIDWKESQILLKAAFPVDIHAEKATYDIQFGNIERATHSNTSWDAAKFEVCAHKWADLSEDGYGVSIINDCKYGHDIKDGVMRLTLLKSGIYPNKDADKEKHVFKYSLYPHADNWRDAKTVQMAYDFNVPLYASFKKKHEGMLKDEISFIKLDKKNVILETVKRAEDSDDIIIRMYECYNRRTDVTVSFAKELKEVYECNLLEQDLNKIENDKNKFMFVIKPYEIKTFRLKTV